jgi:hypothetical protein
MRSSYEVPGGCKVCKYWSTDLWTLKPPIGQITSRTLRNINYCYSYLIYCTTKTGNPPSLFHISHDLLASYDWPAPSIGFLPFFSRVLPGHPLEHLSIGGSIGAPFFQRVPFAVGWSPYFSTGLTLCSSLLFFTIVTSVLLLFSLSFLRPCLMAAAQ